jgi:hypothetical protein
MKIETEAQLESALDSRRDLIVDGDLEITFSVLFSANVRHIRARDISARDIRARDISARDIRASDIRASDISASDIRASDISAIGSISARDIRASDISAIGSISARDISARDIRASDIRASDISASVIKTASIYAIKFTSSMKCDGIYPLSGPSDRAQWAARFGIDTSDGCYKEWHERLDKVAKRLLRKKCWLPIERQMLLSVTGYYKDGVTAEDQFK